MPLRFRRVFELGGLLERRLVELLDLVDNAEGLPSLILDPLFRQLLVVELNDCLDRPCVFPELFADRQHFPENDRGARNRLEHQQLPALDALGDGHFALARQQRYGAHFAEVHAHRIICFFECSRSHVELALFRRRFLFCFRRPGRIGRRKRRLGGREVFVHINAVALDRREQVVNFFRGVLLGRQDIVHLIVEQVAAFLAHGDELPYLVILFFNHQGQRFLPFSAHCQGWTSVPQRDTVAERGTAGRPYWTRTKKKMVKFNLRGDCLPRCSSWVLALTAPMPSGPEPYISSGNFRLGSYLSLKLYTGGSPLGWTRNSNTMTCSPSIART